MSKANIVPFIVFLACFALMMFTTFMVALAIAGVFDR